jgi:hypothetical protein
MHGAVSGAMASLMFSDKADSAMRRRDKLVRGIFT